jgi:replicative DNA helicase
MPHSIEAEQSVLGAILIDNKFQLLTFTFKCDDFYSPSNKT